MVSSVLCVWDFLRLNMIDAAEVVTFVMHTSPLSIPPLFFYFLPAKFSNSQSSLLLQNFFHSINRPFIIRRQDERVPNLLTLNSSYIAQCYRMFNLWHLKRGNIFVNFNDFKPKKSKFWSFLLEKFQIFTKLVVLVAKIHQNLKKIQ